MSERTVTELNRWKETLKVEAKENNVTSTMYKHGIAYKFLSRTFDILKTGAKIDKKDLYESLPYNMSLLSKAKTEARKKLPDQIRLKEFVDLCLCIKSPQDYVNLYLFELLNYPKDEYGTFKLSTKYTYKFASNSIDIILPTNILKGALKLYYDISAINNHKFLKESKDYLQFEIESKAERVRFDLVFHIKTEDRILKYVKEYHEHYHKTNSDRIIADKLEESYLKLNGTALTIFDFGKNFNKSTDVNIIDIENMIDMIINALMFVPELRYKYLLQLFEKDLNDRVLNLKTQIDNTNRHETHYKSLLETYEKKKAIQTEFVSNKSIEKMFSIKEQCYASKNLYIIKLNELIILFRIKKDSEMNIQEFKNYLLGLGFNTESYAWYQISEMISYYNDKDTMKNVLDEYYRYLEKNYTIVIQMKDEFIKKAYPDGSKDYNLYIPFMIKKVTDTKDNLLKKKDEIIIETKKELDEIKKQLNAKDNYLEILADTIQCLNIDNQKLKGTYRVNFGSDSDDEYESENEPNSNDIPVLEVQSDSDDNCDDEFELELEN